MDAPARRALDAVERRASATADTDRFRLESAIGGGFGDRELGQLIQGLRSTCRLTVNFHPDRVSRDGQSVAAGLLRTGRYRPQSETGLSGGGRSAVPGGDRTLWERTLFDHAYDDDPQAVRPIYGALDITGDSHGGSPRFGSSFVVLEPGCVDRTTLTVGDSHLGPRDVGTARQPLGVLAGLFEQATVGEGALGRGLSVDSLRSLIVDGPREAPTARDLDEYVEAQIHGSVELGPDVVAVVLDPSFRDGEIGELMTMAGERYGFELRWHGGSELAAVAVPADFRGPEMVPLAARVARPDGIVDAAAIGHAAAQTPYSPPSVTGDDYDSPFQELKRLWHCLLRFGTDADPPA